MAQRADAIAQYHELLQQPDFRDLSWADELQEDMRNQGLTDSGRLLTPVLRPHFLAREQVARLAAVTAKLAKILARVEAFALSSPQIWNRLGMLPVEKALAALPCGYARPNVASRLDAAVQNGSLSVRGFEPFSASGLAYTDALANLFLQLPIMREFTRSGFKVAKLGGPEKLLEAILSAWLEFGGQHKPNVAILQAKNSTGSGGEAEYIASLFRRTGLAARALTPDQLEFAQRRLRAGDFEVDIVFRRLDTREMLVRCELTHPLIEAYRAGAVCLVNGFRSELWERRASFELLTDEDVTASFSAAECKLIRETVPWTRFLVPRKTKRQEEAVDLLSHITENRKNFVLRPNDITCDLPDYKGAELTASGWDNALRLALRSPYVVQDACPTSPESFPVYRYGEMNLQPLAVSVMPHLLDGAMQGASALLQTCPTSTARTVALAPVLTVQ